MDKIPSNKKYHIAVLGANGGIGRQVTEQALKQGHYVKAILRNPAKLTISHPNLLPIKGDVMQPETFSKYLAHIDVVISAIGKNSFKQTTLYSHGSQSLIGAMKEAGVKRAFFISASGLAVNPTHSLPVRLLTKYVLQRLLRNMYADLERMEQIIKVCGLDWTIMRPPQLTDGPNTGNYRFATNGFLQNGLRISRADVAHFILANIGNEQLERATIELAY